MLSFRTDDRDAESAQRWAERLAVDRSTPATDDERAFDALADWGPAEDWSDWDDAAR